MLRVYIDVDGTILYGAEGDDEAPEVLDYQYVCEGTAEFLEFVTQNCEPYWLTNWACDGDRSMLESDLLQFLPPAAATIAVAHWTDNKTEGIDPEHPFLWFDDTLEDEDAVWLAHHGLWDSFVQVTGDAPDNGFRMLRKLRRYLDET